jgi:hypothetical protein
MKQNEKLEREKSQKIAIMQRKVDAEVTTK